jgi:hypothetical protein
MLSQKLLNQQVAFRRQTAGWTIVEKTLNYRQLIIKGVWV